MNKAMLSQAPRRGDGEALLHAIRQYDMWFVEERLRKDRLISDSEISAAVAQFKDFMYLNAIGYSKLNMPIRQVDVVWHTFLLFTREYAEFCDRYIGGFVHHVPTTSRSRTAPSASGAQSFLEVYKEVFGESLHPVRAENSHATCGSDCDSCRASMRETLSLPLSSLSSSAV